MGLFRRRNKTSVVELKRLIRKEVSAAGSNLGYKSMHHKLEVIHGITASRESVRKILIEVDPDGIKARSHRRMKRRQYICKGPNYSWHIDGYDKLKPYGFCIHGCIDGYSRKMLWLHVASTNNDPKLIASYYLDCVSELGGTARRIRADRGTENVNIEALQKYFRSECTDAFAGDMSFIYGKSTANQRIEAYWGKLRQSTAQFWIDLFKDMTDSGELDDDMFSRYGCILYCFAQLIQNDLDKALLLHNSHRIRPYTFQECPSGKPDLIFQLPEAYGTSNYLVNVNDNDIALGKTMTTVQKRLHGCSDELAELFDELMQVYGLNQPDNHIQARALFNRLKAEVASL